MHAEFLNKILLSGIVISILLVMVLPVMVFAQTEGLEDTFDDAWYNFPEDRLRLVGFTEVKGFEDDVDSCDDNNSRWDVIGKATIFRPEKVWDEERCKDESRYQISVFEKAHKFDNVRTLACTTSESGIQTENALTISEGLTTEKTLGYSNDWTETAKVSTEIGSKFFGSTVKVELGFEHTYSEQVSETTGYSWNTQTTIGTTFTDSIQSPSGYVTKWVPIQKVVHVKTDIWKSVGFDFGKNYVPEFSPTNVEFVTPQKIRYSIETCTPEEAEKLICKKFREGSAFSHNIFVIGSCAVLQDYSNISETCLRMDEEVIILSIEEYAITVATEGKYPLSSMPTLKKF